MDYRFYKNSIWVRTDIPCGRCGEDGNMILREVLNTGEKTNHFTCERLGCTWPWYNQEKLIKAADEHKNISSDWFEEITGFNL